MRNPLTIETKAGPLWVVILLVAAMTGAFFWQSPR